MIDVVSALKKDGGNGNNKLIIKCSRNNLIIFKIDPSV
jgi:hypothetical protein